MRLLEKANAAGDLIRNAAARKFQLQFDSVIMRAIEHRDVAKIDIFIPQLQDSLGNELRLLGAVIQRDDCRFDRA